MEIKSSKQLMASLDTCSPKRIICTPAANSETHDKRFSTEGKIREHHNRALQEKRPVFSYITLPKQDKSPLVSHNN